ncbi:uncharacterized protein MYCGRDRAFT_103671 [Zymoseptoria tritici IPO323]|uniref:Uncharacterized protein n=1 Tax=Zymoseptoria tritici (strain CBS 115943 / IPO323) TaxID=336722 RepID=F9X6T3_ZYMTI|nr:uncharacterized protein MYCGRDRAFT_103671 [Zymoseptoria tritici IPO323]EGP89459.1 hypothetical protein MYCGRDRAFT_103671 [Zymoseptoria tritici IPO323]
MPSNGSEVSAAVCGPWEGAGLPLKRRNQDHRDALGSEQDHHQPCALSRQAAWPRVCPFWILFIADAVVVLLQLFQTSAWSTRSNITRHGSKLESQTS